MNAAPNAVDAHTGLVSHCHESAPPHPHERGAAQHHDCAPCCAGVVADTTSRLTLFRAPSLKIASGTAVTPRHVARDRLDRPPRMT